MAKTYIDTLKYMISAHIEIDGIVEKPDVVGALFGQTEGLLGEDLDLRELQKSGRIGRIEVDLDVKSGKSIGTVLVPSSLDRVETSILAAALETVDRVGPCEAKIKIESIDDTRKEKRSVLVGRAKDILQSMMGESTPETKEISEKVRSDVKTAELEEYGPDKLAAGPDVDESEQLVVVEGRADVITLLKCDIKNVISLQGKKIPKTVIGLAKDKEITAFVDGDRGGDLVIKQLADEAKVDFVAKAPDGKEVEELTKKEVMQALRRKIAYDQFVKKTYVSHRPRASYTPRASTGRRGTETKPEQRVMDDFFENILRGLEGSLRGVLLDKNNEKIAESDVRNLSKEMQSQENIHAVIFDGIVTQRLVEIAKDKNISFLVGIKHGRLGDTGKVKVLTLE
jgi:DNA primase